VELLVGDWNGDGRRDLALAHPGRTLTGGAALRLAVAPTSTTTTGPDQVTQIANGYGATVSVEYTSPVAAGGHRSRRDLCPGRRRGLRAAGDLGPSAGDPGDGARWPRRHPGALDALHLPQRSLLPGLWRRWRRPRARRARCAPIWRSRRSSRPTSSSARSRPPPTARTRRSTARSRRSRSRRRSPTRRELAGRGGAPPDQAISTSTAPTIERSGRVEAAVVRPDRGPPGTIRARDPVAQPGADPALRSLRRGPRPGRVRRRRVRRDRGPAQPRPRSLDRQSRAGADRPPGRADDRSGPVVAHHRLRR
jgi:hypothetical protein